MLIYPEGELTVAGPMKPFLGGTGLICVGGQVPIVPMRLKVNRAGFPSYFPLLRRGDVEVHFGKAIEDSNRGTPATAAIEKAVRAL